MINLIDYDFLNTDSNLPKKMPLEPPITAANRIEYMGCNKNSGATAVKYLL